MKCGDCVKFIVDKQSPSFGWCAAEERRIKPSRAFLTGTTPSTGVNHGKECPYFKAPVSKESESGRVTSMK
jgi:hypothetical protein